MNAAPRVASGRYIAHRLVDVADAIDLGLAESLWAARRGQAGRRSRFASVAPDELAFEAPPLLLPLPDVALEIGGVPATARASARLYDFGAVALALQVDVTDLAWSEFVAGCNAFDRALGPASDSAVWQGALRLIREQVGAALQRPAQRHLEEDYLFAVVHRTEPALDAEAFRAQVDAAPLLSGETRPLSPSQRDELLGNAFSYFEDDLVMLTRDRALVLEPQGETDVIDILEVANAQLLEMRYYDDLMDAELARMYAMVDSARGGLAWLASRRSARLARRIYGLVAEVSRLTGKVEASLQVTEDVYLARVYRRALELFRVPKLTEGVHGKLAIARETYVALYNEASSGRAELLELAIVLLIVFEIVLALLEG